MKMAFSITFQIVLLSIQRAFSSTLILDERSLSDDQFDTPFNLTDNRIRSNVDDAHDRQVTAIRTCLIFGYLGLMCLVAYVCCGCSCGCDTSRDEKTDRTMKDNDCNVPDIDGQNSDVKNYSSCPNF